MINEINKSFQNFLNITIQHIKLLTSDIKAYNHPWPEKSKWVGYSAWCYILPSFFIKGDSLLSYFFRMIWIVQAIFVFSSDYAWATDVHILHGIDRWLATLLVIYMYYITIKYYNKWYILLAGLIPVYCVYLSKVAAKRKDWDMYVFNQTTWHITGPIIACYVLKEIQLNHSLYD